jgi:hypothetical protein
LEYRCHTNLPAELLALRHARQHFSIPKCYTEEELEGDIKKSLAGLRLKIGKLTLWLEHINLDHEDAGLNPLCIDRFGAVTEGGKTLEFRPFYTLTIIVIRVGSTATNQWPIR